MPPSEQRETPQLELARATELLAKPASKLSADEIAEARTIATTFYDEAQSLQADRPTEAIANDTVIINHLTTAAQLFTAVLSIKEAPTLVAPLSVEVTTLHLPTFSQDQIAAIQQLVTKLRTIATAQMNAKKKSAAPTTAKNLIEVAKKLENELKKVAPPSSSTRSVLKNTGIGLEIATKITLITTVTPPTKPLRKNSFGITGASGGFLHEMYNNKPQSTHTVAGLLVALTPPEDWQLKSPQDTITYTDRRYQGYYTQGPLLRSKKLADFLKNESPWKQDGDIFVYFGHENHRTDLTSNTISSPWILIPDTNNAANPTTIQLLPSDQLLESIQDNLDKIFDFVKNGKSYMNSSRPPFGRTNPKF